jgi:hypothetical protein
VIAGNGGVPGVIGTGGDGGDLSRINLTVLRFAQIVRAGAGGAGFGSGLPNGDGGDGGSVTDSRIVGAIGNFAKSFGLREEEMGGLFAGAGGGGSSLGNAGDVIGVTATRIAAILAADSNTLASNLNARNAVNLLRNVTATAIGADVNGDGLFSLSFDQDGDGYVFGTSDVVIDGPVIARTIENVKTLTFPAILVP